MRLIDVDALIEAVENMYEYAELDEVLEVIKEAPTVEPENERALDLIDSLKDRGAINNKERGVLRRAILLNENTRPQGDVNNAIKTIKAVCKDNNICTTCPMNGNCNVHPAKWEEVQE